MEPAHTETIKKAYRHFNRREADEVLPLMQEDVQWPNGWEGGYVQGRQAVKDYWLRQWKELDPVVEPLAVHDNAEGGIEVEVHQIVNDKSGKLLFDATVIHTYFFTDGLIERMEISEPQQASNFGA